MKNKFLSLILYLNIILKLINFNKYISRQNKISIARLKRTRILNYKIILLLKIVPFKKYYEKLWINISEIRVFLIEIHLNMLIL